MSFWIQPWEGIVEEWEDVGQRHGILVHVCVTQKFISGVLLLASQHKSPPKRGGITRPCSIVNHE